MTAYNAADRKDVRKAEKASKIASRQDAEVIQGLMATAPGRAWMHRRLESLHVFHTPFNPDPYVTSFNCGQQNTGLQLLADLMLHCPDQYVLMEREANDRDIASERTRGQNGDGRDQGPSPDSGDEARDDGAGDEARA